MPPRNRLAKLQYKFANFPVCLRIFRYLSLSIFTLISPTEFQ